MLKPKRSGPIRPQSSDPKWPPRIILNTDGCLVFKYLNRRNPDDVTEMLVELAKANVDAVSVLVGINDDLSWRGSPHAELYGDNMGDDIKNLIPGKDSNRTSIAGMHITHGDLLQMNLTAMVEDGHDVLQLYIERARQVGLKIYVSFRMNVGNCNMDHRISDSRRSAMKVSRPDLLIGSPAPLTEERANIWKFCWQWDYAQPEVRERFLGLFEETLTRYDFDGLELDFCRSPLFFKPGQAHKHVSTMTDFMRNTHNIVRNHSSKKDKNIKLMCRVPHSIDASMEVGMDTETWIREGLMDIAVISSPGSSQPEMDVSRAVSATQNSGVLIYAGYDTATYKVSPQDGYELNPPTVPRAIALNAYKQGASGIHLFNYDYSSHRPQPIPEHDTSNMPIVEYPPVYRSWTGITETEQSPNNQFDTDRFTRKDLQALRDLSNPRELERLNRCYYLNGNSYPGEYPPQVPRNLAIIGRGAGPGHAMRLTVEDDIPAGLADGRIKKTELRLRLTDHEKSMNRIRCEVNGKLVDLSSAWKINNSHGEEWLVVDNPPLKQGENTVLVLLEGYKPPQGWVLTGSGVGKSWPTLHQCELFIKTNDALPSTEN